MKKERVMADKASVARYCTTPLSGPSPQRSALAAARRLTGLIAVMLLAAAAGLTGAAARGQAAPPAPPPDPAFPKLFPRYTGANGYEDLVVASDIVNRNALVVIAEQADATLKQTRAALEDADVARALAMVHSGLDKPIQSPRDPDKLDELTLLPEFGGFRRLGGLLAMEEYVALADGRVSKAIDIMRDGLRLGFIVQTETLISGLVGISIDATAVERLARHFDQMSLGDSIHVIGVAQEWLKLQSPTESLLASENKSMHNMLDACRKDPERLRTIVKLMQPKGQAASEMDFAALELSDYVNANIAGLTAIVDQAEGMADAAYHAQVAEIRKPPYQRSPVPHFEVRADMAHRLCGLISPSYSVAMERFDADRARMHLLGVNGAIHRFRWENNRLPGSLADLKLPSLTTDPFTGEPLKYKVTGDRYELYSAGPASRGNGEASIGPIYLPRQ
jgi:hypothetical protein